MSKWLSYLLIMVGLGFVVYAGWQIISGKIAQNEALSEAKSIVSDKDNQIPDDFDPKKDEVIGILRIPKINAELPIVEGTDEDELAKGVGHYETTVFPGQKDQILLSGHRDTVFKKLGELELGDELIVEMSYGDFTYIINDTDIVDADDRTVIRSTAPDEILTLSTCYPFNFIGSAPERYIIYALPKDEAKAKDKDTAKEDKKDNK